MDYLLTSGGVQNPSIHNALREMLRKPIEECHAIAITTASYALGRGTDLAVNFIQGKDEAPMVDLGWKSVGLLELSAVSVIDPAIWQPAVEQADVILVNGGDPLFLHHWFVESGFDRMLPNLTGVYVGMSAGSMILTPRIGTDFVEWKKTPEQSDVTLGLVDFSIFPHLDHPQLPDNHLQAAKSWAETLTNPAYAIDDATAIRVIGSNVDVISEGKWVQFR
ncbi:MULTISPECIES: Type 1 glutamine amidotransferase-like domain-containing protein [unclassified Exiguobacterium]|uniref:Type 1 glutamine amidotransferase-like domain-containing protein n=2 Tax=Exiguobacterium TaxID=33986 RepID=UPI000ED807F8|nr:MULTISPECIES: Type 1 glutamine amidotransferase-like domain-containing protein [unclassified Exiguobacterium]HAK99446.1 peptidase S51 [Exiguobacterium sp.]HCV51880.1 peptidase S51 [Exiguobacterium sp.]